MNDEKLKKLIKRDRALMRIVYPGLLAFYVFLVLISAAICLRSTVILGKDDSLMPLIEIFAIILTMLIVIGIAIYTSVSAKRILTRDADVHAYVTYMKSVSIKRTLKKQLAYLEMIDAYYAGDFEKASELSPHVLHTGKTLYKLSVYNMMGRIAFFKGNVEEYEMYLRLLQGMKYIHPDYADIIKALTLSLKGETHEALGVAKLIEDRANAEKKKKYSKLDLAARAFLSGIIRYRAGLYDEAEPYFAVACENGIHTFIPQYIDKIKNSTPADGEREGS